MKKIYLISFCLIVILNFTNAQWQQTTGPAGGYAVALYAKGDTLYAGNFEHFTLLTSAIENAGTLYRSVDKGAHWYKDRAGFRGVPNSFTHKRQQYFCFNTNRWYFS